MRRLARVGTAAVFATLLVGCDGGGAPTPTPSATPAPTPRPTACTGDRSSEVVLDAEPMNAPSPEAALAIIAGDLGRSVDSYERVPVDPRRYKPKVADRRASFATRRPDGTVATVTVFERGPGGWTLSTVQTCLD